MPMNHIFIRKISGFSLLEVLISLLIIMAGALGIAGIQLQAINNTEVARYQSLAALLASSMAAEMQANVAYWDTAPAIAPTITVSGTTITGGPTSGSCLNTVCNSSQMAYYTLQNWGGALAATLPSGTGTVTCMTTTPAVCRLKLSWNDNYTAISASTLPNTQTYTTLVTVQ